MVKCNKTKERKKIVLNGIVFRPVHRGIGDGTERTPFSGVIFQTHAMGFN